MAAILSRGRWVNAPTYLTPAFPVHCLIGFSLISRTAHEIPIPGSWQCRLIQEILKLTQAQEGASFWFLTFTHYYYFFFVIHICPSICPNVLSTLFNIINCFKSQFYLDFGSYIDGLLQERCNSIANTLELHLSCTNSLIWPLQVRNYINP